MKTITTIYLKLRPDLRDEWLTTTEVEDVQDALAQEQALRKLVKFCMLKSTIFDYLLSKLQIIPSAMAPWQPMPLTSTANTVGLPVSLEHLSRACKRPQKRSPCFVL